MVDQKLVISGVGIISAFVLRFMLRPLVISKPSEESFNLDTFLRVNRTSNKEGDLFDYDRLRNSIRSSFDGYSHISVENIDALATQIANEVSRRLKHSVLRECSIDPNLMFRRRSSDVRAQVEAELMGRRLWKAYKAYKSL